MANPSTVAVRSSEPVAQARGDGLAITRYRAVAEAEVTVPNALVVILCLTPVPTVERRSGGHSEVQQSRMGMVTVPDPSCTSTYTIRGGGNALFVTFPDVPDGRGVRPRFMASEPMLAALATRALALVHLGEAGPLATGELRLRFDEVLFGSADADLARGGLSRAQLRRASEIIEAAVDGSLAHSPTLAELATAAGVSLHHFAREFRRSTGETPYAYSLRRRLDRARISLMETDDLVSAIGYRWGFATPAHFGQHFRAINGVSPGRFRSLVRNYRR